MVEVSVLPVKICREYDRYDVNKTANVKEIKLATFHASIDTSIDFWITSSVTSQNNEVFLFGVDELSGNCGFDGITVIARTV